MIPKLVAALDEGHDLAVGSRYIKGGGEEEWPWYRKLVSMTATLMAYPLVSIRDPMSGLLCFANSD
ncbi:MAG: hypothetical protein HC945_02990 [Nitrosarchaeum sp.]|nr:hypothetical protein [Nitrosarchaeum sp.]